MESKKRQAQKKVQSYTKYSGIAYQMFGLLALSIFLGLKADAYFGNEKKFITAFGTLFVLFTYFYKLYLDLNRKKKN